jgi:glucose-6-phosphate 1-dehydrogenase
MSKAVTLVIFGGTGDLSKRKLAPAIAELITEKKIASNSTILGVGRSDLTNSSYKKLLLDFQTDSKVLQTLKSLDVRYYRGDASQPETMNGLGAVIRSTKHVNRLFYLSTSFHLFDEIVTIIKNQKLDVAKGFVRVAFEKPFGSDLDSCSVFERALHSTFKEEDLFRVDHYLGKETVKNLTVLRYSNPIFDAILNNDSVERIDIDVDEDLAVGKRAYYYNEFGAVKDMFQSHLLQVVALLLMKRPKTLDPVDVTKEKVKILKSLVPRPHSHHLFGQYASYAKELEHLNLENIQTETFAKVVFECTRPEWKGVPIRVRTGKKLARKFGRIIVRFKVPKAYQNLSNFRSNKLIIDIQPEQDIKLSFNLFQLGTQELENVDLGFCHSCHFGPNTSDGYAKMIGDIVEGDKTQFTSSQEVKLSWKITEKVLAMKHKIPFVIYPDGTDPEVRSKL